MTEFVINDLAKLRLFLEVAEHLSFSRAARRLGLGQPTVSRRIRVLEEEVGAPLFDHRKRNLTLSAAGVEMQKLARKMIDFTERVEAETLEIRGVLAGRITIGVSPFWELPITDLIIRFRLEHPSVRLTARYCHSQEMFQMLLESQLGLGFAAVTPDDPRFETRVLASKDTRLMVITCLEHPLSQLGFVDPKALESFPFVWYPVQPGRSYYPEEVGIRPSYALELQDLGAIKRAVESGVGISILPEVDLYDLSSYRLVSRPLEGFTTRRSLLALRLRARYFTPAERAFVSFVRKNSGGLIPLQSGSETSKERRTVPGQVTQELGVVRGRSSAVTRRRQS